MPYERARIRQYDHERDQTEERRFYHSPEWRRMRNAKLAQDPLCERCERHGRLTGAVLVHHKDGDWQNNDPNNYESQCNPCHEEIRPNRFGKGKQ